MGRRLLGPHQNQDKAPPQQQQQQQQQKVKKRQQQQQQQLKKKKKVNKKGNWNLNGRTGKGPRLPQSLRKELHLQAAPTEDEDSDQPIGPHLSDVYEYEEDEAPEDACKKKNRRFDDVERLEYELPSDFEDEDIDEAAADGAEVEKQVKNRLTAKRRNGKAQHRARNKWKEEDSEEDGQSDGESDEEIDSDDVDADEDHDDHDGDGDGNAVDDSDDKPDMMNRDGSKHEADSEEDADEEETGSGESDGDEDDDLDHERHQKMLQAIRSTSNEKNQRKKAEHVELLSEAFPESEFNINPAPDGMDGQGIITVEDLIAPLQGTTGFGSLRKRMYQLDKKGATVNAPLPKAVRERLDRKAGYEQTSKEVSKWQEIVKTNREAPSLVFTQRPELCATSTAELVSKFEPCTDLEKQVASLLQENGFTSTANEEGNELGFNKVSVNEVKERQQRLAKMRSALFYHEAKAKRMKRIKSKTFHRLLQKGQKSQAGGPNELDPEAMREEAVKAEFKRAQERMTLKHKNTSKWAKRIIQRGLKAKDDGTRDAIAEQLRVHTALTRKMQSTDIVTSSDDSSEDEDAASDENEASDKLHSKRTKRLLAKSKMETLKVLEGDAEAEIPTSGLFSLPFMTRAIEKKRQVAANEAVAVLEQLEQFEYDDEDGSSGFKVQETLEADRSSGRLAFGTMAKLTTPGHHKDQEADEMLVEGDSSSDEEMLQGNRVSILAEQDATQRNKSKAGSNGTMNASNASPLVLPQAQSVKLTEEPNDGIDDESEGGRLTYMLDSPWLFGEENGGSLTTPIHQRKENITSMGIETVAIAGKMSSRKRGRHEGKVEKAEIESVVEVVKAPVSKLPKKLQVVSSKTKEEEDEDEDKDEDEDEEEQQFKPLTGDASQSELIQRAFASDDVEADFEELKDRAVSEELPRGETHLELPGWGQWTSIQKKRGSPAWILRKQKESETKMDQLMQKRKDFKLKHVIISEKMDKKAEKFLAPSVPFPFKSRELFEKSIRMPLGREFNTDEAFRDMIRPAVVKDAGVIINPIEYKMSAEKSRNTVTVADKVRKSKKTRPSNDNRPQVKV